MMTFTIAFQNQVPKNKSNKSCTRLLLETTTNTSLKENKEDLNKQQYKSHRLFHLFACFVEQVEFYIL